MVADRPAAGEQRIARRHALGWPGARTRGSRTGPLTPVRVLLVGPYPVDPDAFEGGVQTSFAGLVAGLAELPDLEPHVVSFASRPGRPERRAAGTVPIEYLPGSTRLAFATRHRRERESLRSAVRRLRPDVVHAQDALGSGYVCLRSIRDVPVVVSVHGIVREEVKHLSGLERLRTRVFAVGVERYCIRNAPFLVAPTRYPEQYFGREIRGVIEDVGNAIAEPFFSVERAPEPGLALFSGALIARKRLLDLVEAMPLVGEAVPQVRLRVAGGEPDASYAAAVRQRVRALGLESRVALLGALGPDAMLDEYRRASVLVLPSAQETSPMVIGEAMAAGLPVVATRVGGVPYLVEDGITGHLVATGDVSGLAARVSDVLGDPTAAEALGTAGRAHADRSFRADVVAARVRAVYDRVARGSSH